jgi:hypothetical protein
VEPFASQLAEDGVECRFWGVSEKGYESNQWSTATRTVVAVDNLLSGSGCLLHTSRVVLDHAAKMKLSFVVLISAENELGRVFKEEVFVTATVKFSRFFLRDLKLYSWYLVLTTGASTGAVLAGATLARLVLFSRVIAVNCVSMI